MSVVNSCGPSPYDMDTDVSESLERYFPLILSFARKVVPSNIGPVDSEDVAQEAFIKLMLNMAKRPIESPKTYIRRIIHTIVIDMIRKYKPHLHQTLSMSEDDELQEGNIIISIGLDENDPEAVFGEKEAAEEWMKKLVKAISTFPPHQRYATICTLRDRVDDLIQFTDALQKVGIDSELEWPSGKIERQRLQASYASARKRIAEMMRAEAYIALGQ